jgi:hypothetical protein
MERSSIVIDHVLIINLGSMMLGAGLVLRQSGLVKLSPLQSKVVWWGLAPAIWTVISIESVNAFW